MRLAKCLVISCLLAIPALSVAQDLEREELAFIQESASEFPNADTILLGAALNMMTFVGPTPDQVSLSDEDWATYRTQGMQQMSAIRSRANVAAIRANQMACELHAADLQSEPPRVSAIAEALQSAQTTYYEAYISEFDALLDKLSPEGKTAMLEFASTSRVRKEPLTLINYPGMAQAQPVAFADWLKTTRCNSGKTDLALEALQKPKSFESPPAQNSGDEGSILGGYGVRQ